MTDPRASTPRETAGWLRRAFGLDLRSLAAFRMAIGTVVTADAVLRTRDLPLMFASDGMFPLPVLRRYLDDPCSWSLATLVDQPWCGPAILALEAVAGLLLAAGCCTRPATVVAWVAVVSVLRRTAPATNAGDAWLACLLFWGMFVPLGAVWSWGRWLKDRPPRNGGGPADRPPAAHGQTTICSAGTAALVLQIAVVYLAAGVSKCNDSWLSGDAVRFAMSVHDHGTPLGERLLTTGWMPRLLSRLVPALEMLGPLVLLAAPFGRVRAAVVATFIGFHVAICLTMSVGLFGYVGIAAWLALLPTEVWDRLGLRLPQPAAPADAPPPEAGRHAAACAVAAVGTLAAVSLVHDVTPWRETPLPAAVRSSINLFCMPQEWMMFGRVERQEQWAYARADLADGRVVDLLRDGRPLEAERPAGGFTSLPHHRWHKLLWGLGLPRQRIFAPEVARALAEHWNATQPPAARVKAVELRFARHGRSAADDTFHELLLAAWPPRDGVGGGSLERLLGEDVAPGGGQGRGAAVD